MSCFRIKTRSTIKCERIEELYVVSMQILIFFSKLMLMKINDSPRLVLVAYPSRREFTMDSNIVVFFAIFVVG